MSGVFDDYKIGMSDQPNSASDRDSSDFNALLEKNQQSTIESKLQVARIGGYTKRSVEDFILEMRYNLLQVKAQLEQQIMDLAAEKASVAQECTVLRKQLKTAVETLSLRNQTTIQSDGELSAAEQELVLYREENERLRSMLLLDNQPNPKEIEKFKAKLEQKETEITQLNETLVQYMGQCNALKEKTEQLENIVISSSASDQELAELKQQKEEIEGRYQELLQKIEKSDTDFDELKRQLDENKRQLDELKQQLEEKQEQLDVREAQLDEREAQLDERKKYLDGLQKQLEQEKAYLTQAQAQLEEKQQQLEDIQTQLKQETALLAENQAQLDLKNQQLTELRTQLEAELKAREYIGHMMTKDFADGENWSAADGQAEISGERLFEELYVHFTQLRGKVELQQTMIAEKDTLLEQLKNLEKETAALREENENAKATISSLKKSFEQVMGELDEQTEMLNIYVSRSKKDRDLLKTALSDKGSAQPDTQEAEPQLQAQQSEIAELEEENAKLEEAVVKPYSQILRLEDAKIIPLNDKGHVPDDSAMEYSSRADMTKVADI